MPELTPFPLWIGFGITIALNFEGGQTRVDFGCTRTRIRCRLAPLDVMVASETVGFIGNIKVAF